MLGFGGSVASLKAMLTRDDHGFIRGMADASTKLDADNAKLKEQGVHSRRARIGDARLPRDERRASTLQAPSAGGIGACGLPGVCSAIGGPGRGSSAPHNRRNSPGSSSSSPR